MSLRALDVAELGLLNGGQRARGLGGVEIVMRTEETFGIEIPNEIAAQLLTPAALVEFVAANIPLKATEECCHSNCSIGCGRDSDPS